MGKERRFRPVNLSQSLPRTKYRCMHPDHQGKIPKEWEVRQKCRPGTRGQCPHVMTLEEYEAWCNLHRTYFYGG